jgi:hypothetical protein
MIGTSSDGPAPAISGQQNSSRTSLGRLHCCCIAAVAIATIGATALNFIQEPASVAFAACGALIV